jgi:hypothetical protein
MRTTEQGLTGFTSCGYRREAFTSIASLFTSSAPSAWGDSIHPAGGSWLLQLPQAVLGIILGKKTSRFLKYRMEYLSRCMRELGMLVRHWIGIISRKSNSEKNSFLLGLLPVDDRHSLPPVLVSGFATFTGFVV